jgi:hypothetical protein
MRTTRPAKYFASVSATGTKPHVAHLDQQQQQQEQAQSLHHHHHHHHHQQQQEQQGLTAEGGKGLAEAAPVWLQQQQQDEEKQGQEDQWGLGGEGGDGLKEEVQAWQHHQQQQQQQEQHQEKEEQEQQQEEEGWVQPGSGWRRLPLTSAALRFKTSTWQFSLNPKTGEGTQGIGTTATKCSKSPNVYLLSQRSCSKSVI